MLTLGHGTATAPELASLMREAGITSLVDVRTIPKSRRHPQFWREELEVWVPLLGASAYRWEPRLGGLRKAEPNSVNVALRHRAFRGYADYMHTETFAQGIRELIAELRAARTAIMCSETLWWRCHRRLIADVAVLVHGVRVAHLMHDGKLRVHVPTPGVRVLPDGSLRYDVLPQTA